MEKPLVSICIPAWNAAAFIHRGLESCISQTYSNIEVIVTDDASTDNTRKVVEEYAARDRRIKYFRNDANLNFGKNMFKAYSLALGEYIQYLSHDDWLDLDYVEKKVQIFQSIPNIAWVASAISTEIAEGDSTKVIYYTEKKGGVYTKKHIFRNFYRDSGLVGLFTMFRKKDSMENQVWEMPGLPEYASFYNKGVVIDQFLFLNILTGYGSAYYLPTVIYHALSHEKNASKSYGLARSNWQENMKFMKMTYKGFEYFFKTKAPEDLSAYREFSGNDVIITAILDLVSGRASGILVRQILNFFNDFTLWQKLLTAIYFPLRFMERIFSWILRKSNLSSTKRFE